MLKQARTAVVQHLWQNYRKQSHQLLLIESTLQQYGIGELHLDHFAIIDLPGKHSGIPVLHKIFSLLGFEKRGHDYLAAKQNDFCWLAEKDCEQLPAISVLPQVVAADFRLEEMPTEIQKIILKYSSQASSFPFEYFESLLNDLQQGDALALSKLEMLLGNYLSGRDWPLPTIAEFKTVQAFNELLAWVLVFGRCPNHFTLSIHLLEKFPNLEAFHRFIEEEVKLVLNEEGGKLKGNAGMGIAQGSTLGATEEIALSDGKIQLPIRFVEFVWRYPIAELNKTPTLWGDYFTGFIAQNADRVIESLL